MPKSQQSIGSRLYFSLEEYEQRLANLDEALERLGFETAVVWQRTGGSYDRAGNVYYLTNYASQASGQEVSSGASPVGRSLAALLVRRGQEPELHICEPELTVDRRYVAIERFVGHDDLGAGLAARLVELGIEGPVAYVGDDFLPLEIFRTLTELAPEIEWSAQDLLLYEMQNHKSERELELYRVGGEIASAALTALMEGLVRGDRQSDCAARAAQIIISAGGGFQRIGANSGARAENAMWDNPLYGYSTAEPEPGDLVRGWVYGPIFQGYWLDPGRTSVCGNPSLAQRELIEDTVELTERIMAAIRPGTTPREAGIVGDEFAGSRGYGRDAGGSIWDIYGHGLSTFWLGPLIPSHGAAEFQDDGSFWNVDRPFHTGQVFTVETFLQQPEVGMSAFEEVFIIWDDRLERLTTTPMLFW